MRTQRGYQLGQCSKACNFAEVHPGGGGGTEYIPPHPPDKTVVTASQINQISELMNDWRSYGQGQDG
jgi:hypothetical protein